MSRPDRPGAGVHFRKHQLQSTEWVSFLPSVAKTPAKQNKKKEKETEKPAQQRIGTAGFSTTCLNSPIKNHRSNM